MNIKEIKAKSILRKHKKIDSWFISCYAMNLYRGCLHNCVYCDGRTEKYQIQGEFGKDIEIKINAIEILQRELDPKRKRKPFKKCFMMVGGGACDGYQKTEEKYQLTRNVLHLIEKFGYPVQLLTKSTLIERDLDVIKRINEKSRAIVNFSFSSVDEKISQIFEPNVPSPEKRLNTINLFKRNGISCGMFLMPVIPFLTDSPEMIENSIRKAKDAGVDYIIFSGMTLKIGRQQDYFYSQLKKHFPNLISKYHNIYKGDKWGNVTHEYYSTINQRFDSLTNKFQMPKRMPLHLFQNILDENDKVMVILEHIDYLLKLKGQISPYGYAAWSISKLDQPLTEIRQKLRSLKGVGSVTEKIIKEILDTGNSSYYKKLME